MNTGHSKIPVPTTRKANVACEDCKCTGSCNSVCKVALKTKISKAKVCLACKCAGICNEECEKKKSPNQRQYGVKQGPKVCEVCICTGECISECNLAKQKAHLEKTESDKNSKLVSAQDIEQSNESEVKSPTDELIEEQTIPEELSQAMADEMEEAENVREEFPVSEQEIKPEEHLEEELGEDVCKECTCDGECTAKCEEKRTQKICKVCLCTDVCTKQCLNEKNKKSNNLEVEANLQVIPEENLPVGTVLENDMSDVPNQGIVTDDKSSKNISENMSNISNKEIEIQRESKSNIDDENQNDNSSNIAKEKVAINLNIPEEVGSENVSNIPAEVVVANENVSNIPVEVANEIISNIQEEEMIVTENISEIQAAESKNISDAPKEEVVANEIISNIPEEEKTATEHISENQVADNTDISNVPEEKETEVVESENFANSPEEEKLATSENTTVLEDKEEVITIENFAISSEKHENETDKKNIENILITATVSEKSKSVEKTTKTGVCVCSSRVSGNILDTQNKSDKVIANDFSDVITGDNISKVPENQQETVANEVFNNLDNEKIVTSGNISKISDNISNIPDNEIVVAASISKVTEKLEVFTTSNNITDISEKQEVLAKQVPPTPNVSQMTKLSNSDVCDECPSGDTSNLSNQERLTIKQKAFNAENTSEISEGDVCDECPSFIDKIRHSDNSKVSANNSIKKRQVLSGDNISYITEEQEILVSDVEIKLSDIANADVFIDVCPSNNVKKNISDDNRDKINQTEVTCNTPDKKQLQNVDEKKEIDKPSSKSSKGDSCVECSSDFVEIKTDNSRIVKEQPEIISNIPNQEIISKQLKDESKISDKKIKASENVNKDACKGCPLKDVKKKISDDNREKTLSEQKQFQNEVTSNVSSEKNKTGVKSSVGDSCDDCLPVKLTDQSQKQGTSKCSDDQTPLNKMVTTEKVKTKSRSCQCKLETSNINDKSKPTKTNNYVNDKSKALAPIAEVCEDCKCNIRFKCPLECQQKKNKDKEKRNKNDKNQNESYIAQLNNVINDIQCSCEHAEILTEPFNKKASEFKSTSADMEYALKMMLSKCKMKDRFIEAMLNELKVRASSKIFDGFLNNVANNKEWAPDFDRTLIAKSLPSPASNQQSSCKCSIDEPAIQIIDILRLATTSILVKWTQCIDPKVTGYDILVDGKVVNRVGTNRNTAVIDCLDLSYTLTINVYPMHADKRIGPGAVAIYSI